MAGIIDRRQWLEQRLAFLRERLEANPSDEERKVIEVEIGALEDEARSARRSFRWWLFWGGRR